MGQALLDLIKALLHPVISVPVVIAVIVLILLNEKYKKGSYYKITKNPYLAVRADLGKYGEYLTYKELRALEKDGAKFLFNVYIPKENDETTEIDVLLITKAGVFVIESKNYSGWIFGNEYKKNWYQTLPRGRRGSSKESFYNPIMQNSMHIKYLKNVIGDSMPIHSIIAFSNRCTLKNVDIKNKNVKVINRYEIKNTVAVISNNSDNDILDEKTVSTIYDKLYPYTQVSRDIKSKHIENIKNMLKRTAEDDKEVSADLVESVSNDTNSSVEEGHSFDESKSEAVPADIKIVAGETSVEDFTESATSEISLSDETVTDEKEVLSQQDISTCPKCSGLLVLRTATKGANKGNKFYGCANYPKCRYMKNTMQE